MTDYQYKCTNCPTVFTNTGAFFAHREDCRIKYHVKPHYTLVENRVEEVRRELPNRFGTKVRNALFEQISEREGDWCLHCGHWPARDGPNKENGELEIDHADNNPSNWSSENLHILCNKDNLAYRQYSVETKLKMLKEDSDRNVYVTQERKKLSNTELLKKQVDYSSGDISTQINNLCEVRFRDFALKEVDRIGAIKKEELTDAGAEVAGCSIDTIAKYLRKLCAYTGPLESHKTESGWIITRRKPNA